MADTINKPSIQIRSGLPSPLPDKTPSPATKLLISHGKPNFTIATKSPTAKDNGNPLATSPQPNANNNYNAYKSASNNNNNNNSKFVVGTKFNGVFKPSTAAATWATSNGNGNGNADQNEAAKVVLRRPKRTEADAQPTTGDDENVPEFILRQRRIQERLAKENVLDFENRRSGYFTHVMISPDSPNRTSFVETMSSPAIVPALEMPLIPAKIEEEPPQQTTNGHSEPETETETQTVPEPQQLTTNGHSDHHEEQAQPQQLSNGHAHDDVGADEVAKAIEEVNKAVAGEDDDTKPETESVEVKAVSEEIKPQVAAEVETKPETAEAVIPAAVEAHVEVVTPAEPKLNGDATASNGHDEAITISHTNGHNGEQSSQAATPEGVNYEPKTVVSFSQELGSGENNYPDTVKVVKDAPTSPADAELQELAKLKFDIKSDDKDEVQVTPALRSE